MVGDDLVGKAHLAAPTDTSQQFLAPWLAEFSGRRPRLEIHVHSGDRMHAAWLLGREIDNPSRHALFEAHVPAGSACVE